MKEKDYLGIMNDIKGKEGVIILDPGGVIWDELSLSRKAVLPGVFLCKKMHM